MSSHAADDAARSKDDAIESARKEKQRDAKRRSREWIPCRLVSKLLADQCRRPKATHERGQRGESVQLCKTGLDDSVVRRNIVACRETHAHFFTRSSSHENEPSTSLEPFDVCHDPFDWTAGDPFPIIADTGPSGPLQDHDSSMVSWPTDTSVEDVSSTRGAGR